MLLTRKIVQVDPIEGVTTPVYVREMSARQFAEIADRFASLKDHDNEDRIVAMAELCARCVCDEAGAPLYKSAAEALEEPFRILNVCANTALEINGLDEHTDEHEKN